MESLEHDWRLAKARVTKRSQDNGRVTNMANLMYVCNMNILENKALQTLSKILLL